MTTTPIEIDAFFRALRLYEPQLRVQAGAPHAETGVWWIDLRLDGYFEALSWQVGKGFGFYDASSTGFGAEAPQQLVKSPARAASQCLQRLKLMGWPLSGAPYAQPA